MCRSEAPVPRASGARGEPPRSLAMAHRTPGFDSRAASKPITCGDPAAVVQRPELERSVIAPRDRGRVLHRYSRLRGDRIESGSRPDHLIASDMCDRVRTLRQDAATRSPRSHQRRYTLESRWACCWQIQYSEPRCPPRPRSRARIERSHDHARRSWDVKLAALPMVRFGNACSWRPSIALGA